MASVAQHSREMIRKGSRSFAAAASLFDGRTRRDVEMLYAWCRHCDDVIDGQELGFRRDSAGDADRDPAARLAELRVLTEAAWRGDTMTDPVFEAFQLVMRKREIPLRYPFELLDGFEMDVAGRSYETLTDTLEYCYHVAGVVGVMMARIMGVSDEATLHRAADLGLAFQLTNISRDVMEDAQEGRVYLPLSWLADAGVRKDAICAPDNRAAVFRVVDRLLDEADRYYASAAVGVPELSVRAGWAVMTARNVYRRIGVKIQDRGPDALKTRSATSPARKLYAVMTGLPEALLLKLFRPDATAVGREGLWTKEGLARA